MEIGDRLNTIKSRHQRHSLGGQGAKSNRFLRFLPKEWLKYGWSHSMGLATIFFIGLLFALPLLVIFGYLFVPAFDIWQHLIETVLVDYVINSAILMVGVGLLTLFGGVSCAWLVTMCSFKGRAFFEWALLLPMAMPAYIIAYTYTGLLDSGGIVQSAIRNIWDLNYGEYYFPQVRSLGGAVLMLALVLFPYLYLLTRATFLNQSLCVLEVSRSLGHGAWRTFAMLALPLARPSIIAGLSLVLMEVLADYGTVHYFGISTFSTGIFRTWQGLGSDAGAAQLSALLLCFIFALVVVEVKSRKKAKFHDTSQRHQNIKPIPLTGYKAWLAIGFCAIPVIFGFLLPAIQLLLWCIEVAAIQINFRFLILFYNSLLLAFITACCAVGIAVILAYGQRVLSNRLIGLTVSLVGLGYAIPGTVLAVGVLIPLAFVDNRIDGFMRAQFNISTGLLLSGTLVGLVFAYLVRFLTLSLRGVQSGLIRIKPTLDDAGRALGHSPRSILSKIHLPLLKGSLWTAFLLVFVDVLKELPITLVLRPFNYNTLAVRAYELASDERLAEAAPASLAIVVAGILPVIMISRSITKTRKQHPIIHRGKQHYE